MVSNNIDPIYSATNPRIVVKSRKNLQINKTKWHGACASISQCQRFPTFRISWTLICKLTIKFVFGGLKKLLIGFCSVGVMTKHKNPTLVENKTLRTNLLYFEEQLLFLLRHCITLYNTYSLQSGATSVRKYKYGNLGARSNTACPAN